MVLHSPQPPKKIKIKICHITSSRVAGDSILCWLALAPESRNIFSFRFDSLFSDDCWRVAIYPWPASSDQQLTALETLNCGTASKRAIHIFWCECVTLIEAYLLCAGGHCHQVTFSGGKTQTPLNQCWLLVWRRVFLNYNRQNNKCRQPVAAGVCLLYVQVCISGVPQCKIVQECVRILTSDLTVN